MIGLKTNSIFEVLVLAEGCRELTFHHTADKLCRKVTFYLIIFSMTKREIWRRQSRDQRVLSILVRF